MLFFVKCSEIMDNVASAMQLLQSEEEPLCSQHHTAKWKTFKQRLFGVWIPARYFVIQHPSHWVLGCVCLPCYPFSNTATTAFPRCQCSPHFWDNLSLLHCPPLDRPPNLSRSDSSYFLEGQTCPVQWPNFFPCVILSVGKTKLDIPPFPLKNLDLDAMKLCLRS